jgi:hypothetical protein
MNNGWPSFFHLTGFKSSTTLGFMRGFEITQKLHYGDGWLGRKRGVGQGFL